MLPATIHTAFTHKHYSLLPSGEEHPTLNIKCHLNNPLRTTLKLFILHVSVTSFVESYSTIILAQTYPACIRRVWVVNEHPILSIITCRHQGGR